MLFNILFVPMKPSIIYAENISSTSTNIPSSSDEIAANVINTQTTSAAITQTVPTVNSQTSSVVNSQITAKPTNVSSVGNYPISNIGTSNLNQITVGNSLVASTTTSVITQPPVVVTQTTMPAIQTSRFISGKVFLPDGEVAPTGGFYVSIDATTSNFTTSSGIYIPQGSNSAAYSINTTYTASDKYCGCD